MHNQLRRLKASTTAASQTASSLEWAWHTAIVVHNYAVITQRESLQFVIKQVFTLLSGVITSNHH